MTIMNAIIEDAFITTQDKGFLDAWIFVNHERGHQGFGGFALYLPKGFAHHSIDSPAGHFIFRVMEIAEVTKWESLKGKTIRVDAEHSGINKIGHIVKDMWFCPSEEFKRLPNETP